MFIRVHPRFEFYWTPRPQGALDPMALLRKTAQRVRCKACVEIYFPGCTTSTHCPPVRAFTVLSYIAEQVVLGKWKRPV